LRKKFECTAPQTGGGLQLFTLKRPPQAMADTPCRRTGRSWLLWRTLGSVFTLFRRTDRARS
jgi:hypothetical protein